MTGTSIDASGDAGARRTTDRRRGGSAGRAGAVAAMAMLAAQLVWRVGWPATGVQAFPELVVAAVARLTPLGLFGFATETFGSLAQNSLFVVVLIGTIAAGAEAGGWAARLAEGGRLGVGFVGRLAAGLIVAAVLLLLSLVTILPVANLGLFAAESSRQGAVLVQLATTFALWALVWALLDASFAWARPAAAPAGSATLNRRTAVGRFAIGAGTLALAGTLGTTAWRLMRPRSSADPAKSERVAQEIRATAEARARAGAPVAPTSAPMPQLEVGGGPAAAGLDEPAGATSAAGAADGDPTRHFAELDGAGALTPPLTPVPDFYHVSKNISDPTVDGEGWTLRLHGMVERPLELTYEQVVGRAAVRKITTLGCISNELNGDLIGTAEWQGLPLRDLLVEAGVDPAAVDLVFRCADDYADSIPLAQGMDPDTLLVVGMNGEPLTPDHGYPARMIVPGIYGMKNVKWLQSIEAVDVDFKGYWQTRGWSDPAPYQIWARIDRPEDDDSIPAGPAVAAGVASAGDRGVSRVEVSLDDGVQWAEATLEPAINPPFTWVRWVFPFEAVAGEQRMQVRVTDGNGEVATDERQSPLPDGATGWPDRSFEVKG